MLDMPQIETIRHLRVQGDTIEEISVKTRVSKPTVIKYLKKDGFSPEPPIRQERPSKLDPFKPIVDGILEKDRHVWRKQRHTAKRIYERLRDEHGYDGSYNTVQRYVKSSMGHEVRAQYLDLVWDPGAVQAGFGEADVLERGVKVRRYFLAVSSPHSNMGFSQLFSGETTECVCQGLKDIFEHIGGIPTLAVFDNATGVGRKVCGAVRETKLFRAFRLHHGFEARFCNPDSGHEKGSVENKVRWARSNQFVPMPAFDDVESFNIELLRLADMAGDSPHYRKDATWKELFEDDVAAMRTLPAKPFDVVRYEMYRTDKYGMVTLDGCHRYSTRPSPGVSEVVVGIRARSIVVLDGCGQVVAEHARSFGNRHTESIGHSESLRPLAKRPGGWLNSRVRRECPKGLRDFLDAQEPGMLTAYVQTMDECAHESGLETVMTAMDTLVRRSMEPRRYGVEALVARTGGFGLGRPPEPGPELSYYDRELMGRTLWHG